MSSKLIAALLLGLTLGLAHAEPPLSWEQLGEAEQQVLKPYAERWDSSNVCKKAHCAGSR